MLVLNVVLAIAVVGGVLGLLSWAIVSSRAEQPLLTSAVRRPHPYARPHIRHPHWPVAHGPQSGARERTRTVTG